MNAHDARHHREGDDVGTLWMVRRPGQVARCALVARSHGWELQVLVDGERLTTERCQRGADAFTVAAYLKEQLIRDGWQPVVPSGAVRRVS